MNLNNLSKITTKSAKRLGRGLGSGKGKTGGRGMKGQKARGKIRVGFIGGTLPVYRKLPLRRGKGNSKVTQKALVLDIALLRVFKKDGTVDLEALVATNILKKIPEGGVKILGFSKLEQPLTVKLPTSKSARESIEKAGGKVINA